MITNVSFARSLTRHVGPSHTRLDVVSMRRESRVITFLFPGLAGFLNLKSCRISCQLIRITLMASSDTVLNYILIIIGPTRPLKIGLQLTQLITIGAYRRFSRRDPARSAIFYLFLLDTARYFSLATHNNCIYNYLVCTSQTPVSRPTL